MRTKSLKTSCSAYYGEIVVRGYPCTVFCTRQYDHLGMHTAAPLGQIVEWIEPSRTRGIAKATGDERMIASPSDRRGTSNLSWWQRLWRWLMSAW